MTNKLIAREKECGQLERCLQSDRSEFVIVGGRRRIGKTFLVEQYFEKTYAFKYVGVHKQPMKTQLANFAKAIAKYADRPVQTYADWFEAFDALETYLESLPGNGRKKVVFIDEMPWIDSQRSDFVSALENFWNGWAISQENILFVATGSATSWMMDKLVQNQGGLHARITASIYLSPFSLAETETYLNRNRIKWTRRQVLQCYMIFGGVPYYLSLLNAQESLAQNVDRLFFANKAELRMEFAELYNAIFTNADRYISVVKLLSAHMEGMSREEIATALRVEGTQLTTVLINLEHCDFIARWSQFGNKKKETLFRLVDFYTLFYYAFIENDNSRDEEFWTHNLNNAAIDNWMGHVFEIVCMQHHKQIKKALGIMGMHTAVSSWRKRANKEKGTEGAQIDLVIERADDIIHLCEIKFTRAPYVLRQDYLDHIERRMWLFQEATGTNKAVVTTFVTTYGLSNPNYSHIVHSVLTMDDLFNC